MNFIAGKKNSGLQDTSSVVRLDNMSQGNAAQQKLSQAQCLVSSNLASSSISVTGGIKGFRLQIVHTHDAKGCVPGNQDRTQEQKSGVGGVGGGGSAPGRVWAPQRSVTRYCPLPSTGGPWDSARRRCGPTSALCPGGLHSGVQGTQQAHRPLGQTTCPPGPERWGGRGMAFAADAKGKGRSSGSTAKYREQRTTKAGAAPLTSCLTRGGGGAQILFFGSILNSLLHSEPSMGGGGEGGGRWGERGAKGGGVCAPVHRLKKKVRSLLWAHRFVPHSSPSVWVGVS